MQLAEVKLWADDGSQISVARAVNVGGEAPYPGQVASRSIDGSTSTKWTDMNFLTNGYSLLELTLDAATKVSEFELFTANDNTKRDPVSWTFGGAQQSGGPYEMFRSVQSYVVPEDRLGAWHCC